MKKNYRVYQVDAFTRSKFKGNPAGVVTNAGGLTGRQMQEIARELNNSETAFIFPAEAEDHDVRIRFFTPTVEVPSCGHATIAAHYARAVENRLPSLTVMQKIQIGILPVDVIKEDEDYRVVMTQGDVKFPEKIEGLRRQKLLKALNIREADLDERCPVEHVSTGHSKIILGLRKRELLNSLNPDLNMLKELDKQFNCRGYFVFTFDTADPEILTAARMFAPQIGISEDPVTGNGNGPLGAYLVKHKLVSHDGKILKFKGRQGEAMGRPGIAHVEIEIENERPVKVKVGGEAVIVFQTGLFI